MSGGQTRRAAMVAAGVVGVSAMIIAPYLQHIPVSALTGVLLSVAFKMFNPSEGLKLMKSCGWAGAAWATTVFSILTWGVTPGTLLGLGAAMSLQIVQALTNGGVFGFSYTSIPSHWYDPNLKPDAQLNSHVVRLEGGLTFLTGRPLRSLREELHDYTPRVPILFDATALKVIDMTAAEQLIEIVRELHSKHFIVKFAGWSDFCKQRLAHFDPDNELQMRPGPTVNRDETQLIVQPSSTPTESNNPAPTSSTDPTSTAKTTDERKP
jgi:MFS superfamily sulfate permease-like transporter